MKKTLLLLAALTLSPALYAQDYHVVLWDNATAPTSNGLTGEEIQPKPGQWSNTQKAEMWIYKAGDNATGQALVFFPGGGYSTLSVGNGHKEAKWFAENGVTAAVVKYRLPNGHSEVPRNDADEALRVMREMAAELNIDPAKVGVSGTSAGGYLAGSVGTLSEVKPDFMILYYPVISADADKRHKGTFVQLLGADDADKPVAQEFSLEKKVDRLRQHDRFGLGTRHAGAVHRLEHRALYAGGHGARRHGDLRRRMESQTQRLRRLTRGFRLMIMCERNPRSRTRLRGFPCSAIFRCRGYSTVTDLARLRGWSTLRPLFTAI